MIVEQRGRGRRRARRMMWVAALLAIGCAKSDPGGSSSSTNFISCSEDADCLGHAGAVRCDAQGYCLDQEGEREWRGQPRARARGRVDRRAAHR